jgi:hypothetical protein
MLVARLPIITVAGMRGHWIVILLEQEIELVILPLCGHVVDLVAFLSVF